MYINRVIFLLFTIGLVSCSSNNQDAAKEDGFKASTDHEYFSAKFPQEPEVEFLPGGEIRWSVTLKECTYVVFLGKFTPETKMKFAAIDTRDVVTTIAEAFKFESGYLGADYEYTIKNESGYHIVDFSIPDYISPTEPAFWKRVYLRQDELILILLSSPERKIVERDKEIFLKHFKLKW
jgi:hypothetical protein